MNWREIKIPYIFRLVIFWICFFISFRILFVIYQHAKIPDDLHSDTSLAFYYALPIDISAAFVMAVIPFVLWVLQQFYKTRFIHRVNKVYNASLIAIVSLLSVTNIKMYGEWNGLLTFDILKDLFYPSQSLSFFSLWSVFLLVGFSVVLSYIAFRLYKKYIINFSHPIADKRMRTAHIVLVSLIFVAGYRIDLNIAAIKNDRIHYSELEINNHIATNNIWYFANSIVYGDTSEQ